MALNWFKKKEQQKPADSMDQQPDMVETTQQTEPDEAASEPTLSDARSSQGFFNRLKRGLAKTRQILTTDINDLFTGNRKVDAALLEDLEELLITSDIGVKTAADLIQSISSQASRLSSPEDLKDAMKAEILKYLKPSAPVRDIAAKPHIIMVVGVNGVGKTTTIGKLAAKYRGEGKKVLIAAADTFRAAAVEQLTIWAERAGVDIIHHKHNADPAAVVYDSIEAALSRKFDIVIVDTAGRLHTKVNLMEELKKIQRTITKKIPDGPHEILLILDATTGQNALSQAKLFNDAVGITGIALTKLDGTAKGGIVISICRTLNIPLNYIGVGEGIEDLQHFDPEQFVKALFDQ